MARWIEGGEEQLEILEALSAKSDKLAELKGRVKWSTRFFEALYHLAGLGFHAERLRTPARSRSHGESGTEGSREP